MSGQRERTGSIYPTLHWSVQEWPLEVSRVGPNVIGGCFSTLIEVTGLVVLWRSCLDQSTWWETRCLCTCLPEGRNCVLLVITVAGPVLQILAASSLDGWLCEVLELFAYFGGWQLEHSSVCSSVCRAQALTMMDLHCCFFTCEKPLLGDRLAKWDKMKL